MGAPGWKIVRPPPEAHCALGRTRKLKVLLSWMRRISPPNFKVIRPRVMLKLSLNWYVFEKRTLGEVTV